MAKGGNKEEGGWKGGRERGAATAAVPVGTVQGAVEEGAAAAAAAEAGEEEGAGCFRARSSSVVVVEGGKEGGAAAAGTAAEGVGVGGGMAPCLLLAASSSSSFFFFFCAAAAVAAAAAAAAAALSLAAAAIAADAAAALDAAAPAAAAAAAFSLAAADAAAIAATEDEEGKEGLKVGVAAAAAAAAEASLSCVVERDKAPFHPLVRSRNLTPSAFASMKGTYGKELFKINAALAFLFCAACFSSSNSSPSGPLKVGVIISKVLSLSAAVALRNITHTPPSLPPSPCTWTSTQGLVCASSRNSSSPCRHKAKHISSNEKYVPLFLVGLKALAHTSKALSLILSTCFAIRHAIK